MRVFITGGTGLIGRGLVRSLLQRGDVPVVLSRHADRARLKPSLRGAEIVQGDPSIAGGWDAMLDGCDAVIHLAGHNIFSERWNDEVRRKIRDSRVQGTQNLVGAIARASRPPRVLVQCSAIGYYGPHGDEELNESSPPGDDFMARVCVEWEAAAAPARELGLRVPIIRTGIVLAEGEGALAVMTPIFKWVPLGAAPIGNGDRGLAPGRGRQWMSWIHLDDIVGLFLLGLDNPEANGPINGTAPNPVRNADFSRTMAKVLWKPSAPWRFYVPFGPPDIMLKVLLGDVAQVITKGQKVLPERAEALGYTFRYPQLEHALRAIFDRPVPGTSSTARPAAEATKV